MSASVYTKKMVVNDMTVVGANTKGDLLGSDGSRVRSLPLGNDGDILTVNSTKDIGVEWVPSNAKFQKLTTLDNHMFEFEIGNVPTVLTSADFVNGTYRIKTSGVYTLGENIDFNPNTGNDHMPTQTQIDNGTYPVMPLGPYHLGFFAAISVEADNVVINLNGFELQQHPAHQLQQRFFSCIELGSSPFVSTQGPSNFGDAVVYPNNVLIKNGTLGSSSHHGLHGNSSTNVILSDIVFKDFELAGWALNGCSNVLLRNLHATTSEQDIKVSARYSQARFIRSFLQKIIDDNGSPGPSINIRGVSKSGLDILNELQAAMDSVYDVVVNSNGTLTSDAETFQHSHTGLDGGIYGGVMNTFGVAVDGFIRNRDSLEGGNQCIQMENITIDTLTSTPVEIVGLSLEDTVPDYGLALQKGPVGDVFQILHVTNLDGSYKPNVLANAQIYISAVGVGAAQRGGSSIDSDVIAWAAGNDLTIAGTRYFVSSGDSMAHTMKGNIGLFLSGATDVQIDGLVINDMNNLGNAGEVERDDGVDCVNDDTVYEGDNSRGLALVSCKNCDIKQMTVTNIKSKNGSGIPIDFIGENVNVHFE
jgi:hypothetical protein